jgi:hypothetical protein
MSELREPLDDVLVTTAAFNALEIAGARRAGRPVGTTALLSAILAVDDPGPWNAVQLGASFLDADAVADYPDLDAESDGVWCAVPLTATATRALATAARIARDYDLEPMPPGALALGLVSEPESGASRALLDGATIDHAGLLALIQDEVLGTNLVELDVFEVTGREKHEARGAVRRSAGDKLMDLDDSTPFAVRALARARAIDATPDPSSLALLIAAIEGVKDPELADLVESMLLDPRELTETAARTGDVEDVPAIEVLAAARRRFDDELDAEAVIVAVTLRRSPRVTDALHGLALSPEEVAGQLSEWRLREDGDTPADIRVTAASIANFFLGVATTVLLVAELVAEGGWWRLVLLPLVWAGYPQEGPVVGFALAGVFALLVSPLVGVVGAVAVLGDIGQALAERQVIWERTGVRLSIREVRHVVQRVLRKRSRTFRMTRQAMQMRMRGSGERLAMLAGE